MTTNALPPGSLLHVDSGVQGTWDHLRIRIYGELRQEPGWPDNEAWGFNEPIADDDRDAIRARLRAARETFDRVFGR